MKAKNNKHKYEIIFVIFLLFSVTAYSHSNVNSTNYGVYSALNINTHNSDFNKIPECPSCSPGYHGGIGIGLSFGLSLDIPIDNDFSIGSRLFYKNLSAELVSTEHTNIVIDNQLADGEFEHSLDTKIKVLGLETMLRYNFYDNLFISLGLQGATVISKEYSQVERITKPSDAGTFLDANGNDTYSRERNKFSGTLESANSLFLAIPIVLSYQLPLNPSFELLLEPEISYNYSLTNVISDEAINKWRANSICIGIGFKYSPKPEPPTIEKYHKTERTDTVRIISADIDSSIFVMGKPISTFKTYEANYIRDIEENIIRIDTLKLPKIFNFTADISVVGVDSLQNEIINPKFKIEEFVSNRLDPILNYIFFDNNSSIIPNRYKLLNPGEIDNFHLDSLYRDSKLDIYYNLLNIIGKRLIENDKSSITIVGCNSDIDDEKKNKALSLDRANAVKKYFETAWGINPKRLKIQNRNLPSKPSIPKTEPEKIQENSRVEIYSDDIKILEPVFIKKLDRVATPKILRFKPNVIAEAGLTNWSINAVQKSDSTIRFSSDGTNIIDNSIDWNLESSQKTIPIFPEPIYYSLSTTDNKKKTLNIQKYTSDIELITVEKKRTEQQGDYEIERFSLILFDFDKARIEENNKNIIEFIFNRIQEGSEVEIIGYTDRTGEIEHNKELSQQRATIIRSALKYPNAMLKVGEELLFDNNLPEGRFFCRAVDIIVKTKINKENNK